MDPSLSTRAPSSGQRGPSGPRRRSPLLDVLRTCVRQHDWSLPPEGLESLLHEVPGAALLSASRRHRVAGCVRNSVRHLPGAVAPEVSQALQDDAEAVLAQHMRALAAVHLLGVALDPVVSTWAVVKGPVLAAHVYDRADLRSYKDVDVLVRPAELGAAMAALEAAGCTVIDRNWTLLRKRALGEVHVLTPTGLVVDLHWSLLNREKLRRTFAAGTDAVLDRSVEVALGGRPVRTLDPFDTVVHLAVHAAMSGGDRLVWLKDIEQAVRHVGGEWDELADRARRWRAQLLVGAMLGRTSRLLGLDTGGLDADSLLGSRSWAAVLAAVEARDDFAAGGERGSLTRMLTRSLRADAAAGAAEASLRAAGWLRHRSTDGRDRVDDPGQPHSVHYDAGGPAGREAYLQDVARWR